MAVSCHDATPLNSAKLVHHLRGRSSEGEVLAGLEFPVSINDINTRCRSFGLSREALLNALGDSP